MRALVYGGAFNPPTKAHIELADLARREAGFEKVIFVPSKMRYIQDDQKKDFAFRDEERLAMLRKIADSRDWMEVSDYELLSKEQPRTYFTLCHLREMGCECSLLFGSDKLAELETVWQHVDDIAHEFGIYCMERYEDDCEAMMKNDPYLQKLIPYVTIIHTPSDFRSVSSTQVRKLYLEAVNNLNEIADLIPEELDGLRDYICAEE